LIVYELVQYILPGRNTYDWRDIIATIIAGIISLGIYNMIYSGKLDFGRELFSNKNYDSSNDDK
jgi:hypothetical protein